MRKVLIALVAVVLSTLVAVAWMEIGTAEAHPNAEKRKNLRNRTPDEVVSDLRDALAAGDWDAVASNYAADAFLIDDQGVLIGPDEIVESFMSLDSLFEGAQPAVNEENVFQDTVRVLFELDGGWVVIPDGVDTFVIRRGLIRRQTRHAVIEFTGPPPEQD
jgi:hypothetical protein